MQVYGGFRGELECIRREKVRLSFCFSFALSYTKVCFNRQCIEIAAAWRVLLIADEVDMCRLYFRSCVHLKLPPQVQSPKNQKRFLASVCILCIELYIIVGRFCTSGETKIGA